jgi:citrate lyase subunit beta / citryl-CoA lyase
MTGIAGNMGESIRSDCFVSIGLSSHSGIEIDLKSKVSELYGRSIRQRVSEMLAFFGIEHARVSIIDEGALDFVLAARIEAAIKQVKESDKEYLLPLSVGHLPSPADRLRRSRLYIPGNSPKLMINAGIHAADGIILDLEDSVAPSKKQEARYLVRNALRTVDFYGAEKMVRINQLPMGLEDLKFLVSHSVQLILIPKCESPEQVKLVDEEIIKISGQLDHGIHLMPIIESALGAVNAYPIATASEHVVAMAIGLEDYTADLGVQRSESGQESCYARSALINAAVAAGKQAIDSVYSDVGNMEGLKRNVTDSRALGFTGMGCIHPRQIPLINTGYNPGESEIEKAKSVVKAFEEAEEQGLGVIALGTKMIDLPVVKRAQRTIAAAISGGLLPENWREDKHE